VLYSLRYRNTLEARCVKDSVFWQRVRASGLSIWELGDLLGVHHSKSALPLTTTPRHH
jgi:hypothetical protein